MDDGRRRGYVQVVTGTLRQQDGDTLTLDDVALTGNVLTFRAGGVFYRGVVDGDTITGTATVDGLRSAWTVTRARP